MKKTIILITFLFMSIISNGIYAQTNTQKAINTINGYLSDCPSSLTFNHDNLHVEANSVTITYSDPLVKIKYISNLEFNKQIWGIVAFNLDEAQFKQYSSHFIIESPSGVKYSNSNNTKKLFDSYKIEINSSIVLSRLIELFNNLKHEAALSSSNNDISPVSNKQKEPAKNVNNLQQSNSDIIIFKYNKVQMANTDNNYQPIESTTKVLSDIGEIIISKKSIIISKGLIKEVLNITKSRNIENRYEIAAKNSDGYYSLSLLKAEGANILILIDYGRKTIKVYNIISGFTLNIPFLKNLNYENI